MFVRVKRRIHPDGESMSVFEYVFSLYSLLLGLALAHLLSGLAKVVEARGKVRLGWPTALLALVMMSSLTIFWEIAWRARDAVPDNSAALFASLIICSLLYFGAVLVLPSDTSFALELHAQLPRSRTGRAHVEKQSVRVSVLAGTSVFDFEISERHG